MSSVTVTPILPAPVLPLEELATVASEASKLMVPHVFNLSDGVQVNGKVIAGLKPFDMAWDEVFLDHIHHYHRYGRRITAKYVDAAMNPENNQEMLADCFKKQIAHLLKAYLEILKVLCFIRYALNGPAHFAALPAYCPDLDANTFRYKFQAYHVPRPPFKIPYVYARCVTATANGQQLDSAKLPEVHPMKMCKADRAFRFLRRKLMMTTIGHTHKPLPPRFRNVERYFRALSV